jgi:uncharacterized protein YegL
MTKPAYTHIISILDTSGSMSRIIDELASSFESFCLRQKEVPGDVTCSVYTFNSLVEKTESFVDVVNNVIKLPRFASGGTALFDAIGYALNTEGAALSNMAEDQRPSKVIVTILTDGDENASKEFRGEQGRLKIKELLEHQQSKYSWEVIFMGANIDAQQTSASIGIASSIQYDASVLGTREAYRSVTKSVLESRKRITP